MVRSLFVRSSPVLKTAFRRSANPIPFRRPLLHFTMSTTTVITEPAQAQLATIDLSTYDAEQAKLMEERCILVDEQDRAYGASDKKTCKL